jgi:hypothetical protein
MGLHKEFAMTLLLEIVAQEMGVSPRILWLIKTIFPAYYEWLLKSGFTLKKS